MVSVLGVAGLLTGLWLKLAGVLMTVSVVTYLLPYVLTKLFPEQNLKLKYGASWALVTGGSSGIGLALARKLAKQGLNLVIVAVDDATLKQSVDELRKEFSGITIRQVGVDLSGNDYMDKIRQATNDVAIQIVFCNAGYIKTGFFDSVRIEPIMANYHCNATSSTVIAHHFIEQMTNKKTRGCVCFTSSPAGLMPTPFSAMYGATKAYLSELAMSIAPEVKGLGIDIAVCHPSPVKSRFYDHAHSLDMLEMFKKTGTTPDTLASYMLASIGRLVVIDQGYYCAVVRMLLKVVDVVFLTEVITRIAHALPDFKMMRASQDPSSSSSSSKSSKTKAA